MVPVPVPFVSMVPLFSCSVVSVMFEHAEALRESADSNEWRTNYSPNSCLAVGVLALVGVRYSRLALLVDPDRLRLRGEGWSPSPEPEPRARAQSP